MKKTPFKEVIFLSILSVGFLFVGSANAQCGDPWVSQTIREVVGRPAKGSGNTGECDIKRYGGGSWSGYEDLKNKVRASLFNGDPEKKKERCFGAQGSGCDALQVGVFNFKAGRTNLSNGWFRMWISVGSIKHDNCCISNPFGKMCGGNDAAKSLSGVGDGTCVQEWDKAFWNAMDGRAWTVDLAPWAVPDLTIVANPRSTRSQNGTTLVAFETAETRKRSAPRGQALDPGDEAFCSSGRATTYSVPFTVKKWIICE